MSVDNGKLLAQMTLKRGVQLQARLRIFKGFSVLDLREWVWKDGETVKTNRGVMIPLGLIDRVIGLLEEAKKLIKHEGNTNA